MQEDPLLSRRLKLTIITCCFEVRVLENGGKAGKGKNEGTIYTNPQRVVSHDVPTANNGIKRGGCLQTSQDVFNSFLRSIRHPRASGPARSDQGGKPRFNHGAEGQRKLLASALRSKSRSHQSGLFLAQRSSVLTPD